MIGISSLWQTIKRGKEGKNIGTSTGIPKLDKIIGGIQPSRYYLIGGASSSGKSSLVLYMMYYTLKNMDPNEPVYYLYFSLELGQEILWAKLMGLYCAEEFGIYLSINDIMSFECPIDDSSFQCLEQAKLWLENISSHITILDKMLHAKVLYRETMTFIEKYITITEANDRKDIIPNNPNQKLIGVIDHMSLIQSQEGRTLKQEMDLTSSFMVTLKRKFKMSWFVLMQQNRDSSSTDRRKLDLFEPGLNDLKDSGNMGQDADVVIQIYYPFKEKLATYRDYTILGDKGFKDNFRSLIISKNRYGVANQVIGTAFYGSVGWFKDLPPGRDIIDQTIYFDQQVNIPCKIKRDLKQEDTLDRKESEEQSPLIFKL